MFDLNNGVVRTKLLADKAQGDGYPVHKGRPDFVKKAIHIFGSQVSNKLWKSAGRRLGEKPMKMLMAQELSNAKELKEKPPNVVAKLMGLNSLPVQRNVPSCKNNLQDNCSNHFSSRGLHWQQEEGYHKQMRCVSDLHIHKKSYKDVYEVNQKLTSDFQLENENNPHHEDYHRSLAEKRMALVHQKFLEAKRLATNEKLLQSKEFKDALEVLSSNRDLFLKLLEEPNTLLSNQLKELNQTTSLATHAKCITVLKPTTSADVDCEKSASKNRYTCGEEIMGFDGPDRSPSLFIPKAEFVSHPTRIVVLKASNEMPPESRYMNGDLAIDEDVRSREVAKEVTYQMQKDDLRCTQNDDLRCMQKDDFRCTQKNDLRCTQKDDLRCAQKDDLRCTQKDYLRCAQKDDLRCTQKDDLRCALKDDLRCTQKDDLRCMQKDMCLKASALSNGYLADESSLNRSEDYYREEGGSDCNDSELMTPTSRNSCVHMRSGNPGSLSTFNNASYSFESTVSREAKKRSLERWESVISNDINHELANARKSSSTLGEMLAIPEVKREEEGSDKPAIPDVKGKEEEADKLAISPCVSYCQEQYTSITRSISLPASPYYENVREKEEISRTLSSNSFLLKQVPKMKNAKSSFKEKVSGLFFSRMKTLARDKPILSSSVSYDGRLHVSGSSAVKYYDNLTKDSHRRISDKNASKSLEEKNVQVLSPISFSGTEKHGKGIRSIEKLWKSEVYKENCNQPSYISESERPFQENFISNPSHSSESAFISNPQALSRSPLISSVSRSSNRESLHSDSVPINSFKLFRLFSKEDEEQERLDFIAKLLSSSNLANERTAALLAKLHSLDSPLDPTLLDGFLDRKGEDAKCRERRSNQMLYFDSVNVALKNICLCSFVHAYPWSTATTRTRKHVKSNLSVRDAVWFHIKDLISEEDNCSSGKAESSKKYVDCLGKKEAAGSGLAESMWLEMDELSKEIGENLLEELFEDTLTDLTIL